MSHPLISGRIPIHPELQGELYFPNPSKTSLTLGHDDFLRFLPEMNRNGMHESFPQGSVNINQPRQQFLASNFSSSSSVPCSESSQPNEPPFKTFVDWNQFNNFSSNIDKYGEDLKISSEAKQTNQLKTFVHINNQEPILKEKSCKIKRRKSTMKKEMKMHWLLKDAKSMQKVRESDEKPKLGLVLRDKLRPLANMYLPDINTFSERRRLPRNNSYRWLNHHSSDESSSASDMSYSYRIREQDKENNHRIKKEKINKLVIPIGEKDGTIRIYVPPKPPDTRNDITQDKSTLIRMIDDFHANLPPASEEDTTTYTSTRLPSTTNTLRENRNTVWSVRSSVASFDYHDVREDNIQDKREVRDDQYEPLENYFSPQYTLPYKDRKHKLIRDDHNNYKEKCIDKDNKDMDDNINNKEGYKNMSNKAKQNSKVTNDIYNIYNKIMDKNTHNNIVKKDVHNSEAIRNVQNMKKEYGCKKRYQPIMMDEPPSYYAYSTLKQETEKLIEKEKPDKLKDLNYITRSKSAKKEQRARAVQRSKTIYLNLSKGKNDGALAKLIEDSTENRFSLQFLFQGLWKKKKSVRF